MTDKSRRQHPLICTSPHVRRRRSLARPDGDMFTDVAAAIRVRWEGATLSTWLITGCSTGLGRALAEAVVAHGHNVVATARDTRSLEQLRARASDQVHPATLDVTDAAQITRVVQEGTDRFGAIDVLVTVSRCACLA